MLLGSAHYSYNVYYVKFGTKGLAHRLDRGD